MHRVACFAAVLVLILCCLGTASAENTEIVITFTGDCTLGCDKKMVDSPYSFLRYIEDYGYGYPFENVRSLFENDDLTVINLEGVFSDSDKGIVDKTYNFRAPKDYVNILTSSSVEAVSFGNNHSMDFGDFGCLETIDALEKAGVNWFGCNLPVNANRTSSQEISKTWIFEKEGVKIGFVAAWISNWWADKDVHRAQVDELKAAGCGLIIACLHGGVEYDPVHDNNQEYYCHAFQKYGCDLIIANHPHVLQGIEYNDMGTIVYSLGNFCFGGNQVIKKTKRSNSLYTAVCQITLSFDENGTYLGHQMSIYPFCTGKETNEKSNYQPYPATGKDAEKVIKAIWTDTRPRKSFNQTIENGCAVQPFVPAPVRNIE